MYVLQFHFVNKKAFNYKEYTTIRLCIVNDEKYCINLCLMSETLLKPNISISLIHQGRMTHMCSKLKQSMVQIMVCRLVGAKLLFEPMVFLQRRTEGIYIQLTFIWKSNIAVVYDVCTMMTIVSRCQCITTKCINESVNCK